MDPNNPYPQGNRPAGPSLDGFLPPASTGRPTQPPANSLSPQPGNTPPSARPPAFKPPSADKRPFMPAEFFTPPPLPNLPEIEEPAAPPPEPEPKSQGMRDVLSVFGVLASALLLAFCLINFVFQSYQVEGPSMRTTLENSDHLIVWKVDRTIANATGRTYIPNRGDVVIFNEPDNAEPLGPTGKQLIKRVVGLPGERVVVNGTDVIIYNDTHPNGYHPDKELPYGQKILFEKPNNLDVTVGDDQVFVMGDNRDNSLDSRVFGPLDADKIVGKLVVRILPLNTFKLF